MLWLFVVLNLFYFIFILLFYNCFIKLFKDKSPDVFVFYFVDWVYFECKVFTCVSFLLTQLFSQLHPLIITVQLFPLCSIRSFTSGSSLSFSQRNSASVVLFISIYFIKVCFCQFPVLLWFLLEVSPKHDDATAVLQSEDDDGDLSITRGDKTWHDGGKFSFSLVSHLLPLVFWDESPSFFLFIC